MTLTTEYASYTTGKENFSDEFPALPCLHVEVRSVLFCHSIQTKKGLMPAGTPQFVSTPWPVAHLSSISLRISVLAMMSRQVNNMAHHDRARTVGGSFLANVTALTGHPIAQTRKITTAARNLIFGFRICRSGFIESRAPMLRRAVSRMPP